MSKKTVSGILEEHICTYCDWYRTGICPKEPDEKSGVAYGECKKIGRLETGLIALIESEKVKFAEECFPTFNYVNPNYFEGFDFARRLFFENIRKAKGKI